MSKMLEITSNYRNRNRYPNVGEFTTNILLCGSKLQHKALDPVSCMAPIAEWEDEEEYLKYTTNVIKVVDYNPSTEGKGVPLYSPPSGVNCFTIAIDVIADVSQLVNYMTGTVILVGGTEYTTIFSMMWVGSNPDFDMFKIFVIPALSSAPVATSSISVVEPLITGVRRIYGSININKTFKGFYLWNDELQEGAVISDYIQHLRHAHVDLVEYPNVSATWARTHHLLLRECPPKTFGALAAGTHSITQTTISTTAPIEDNIYVSGYIRFTEACTTTAIRRLTRRITAYNGTNKLVSFTPPLPTAPSATVDFYEILEYTRDNVHPIYNDSKWLTRQRTLYTIELDTLVLPNVELVTGGRITSYPYVYVKIINVDTYTNSKYIMSNNPNASSTLFKAVVSRDIWNPFNKPFIKMSGAGMVQHIQFNIADSVEFGVYMPRGQPFQPIKPDQVSPLGTDDYLQISAKFIITRIQ